MQTFFQRAYYPRWISGFSSPRILITSFFFSRHCATGGSAAYTVHSKFYGRIVLFRASIRVFSKYAVVNGAAIFQSQKVGEKKKERWRASIEEWCNENTWLPQTWPRQACAERQKVSRPFYGGDNAPLLLGTIKDVYPNRSCPISLALISRGSTRNEVFPVPRPWRLPTLWF